MCHATPLTLAIERRVADANTLLVLAFYNT
jgi:hypothetical protein